MSWDSHTNSVKSQQNDRNVSTQHLYRNIVGNNRLRAFGHTVATCCGMLRGVGYCGLKFEKGQIFHATFVDVARCCSRFARFVQQCCAQACALVRCSTRNLSQQGGQTHACNMLHPTMLRSNVAIVKPGLANAEPMLGYVVLRCYDRLAGAQFLTALPTRQDIPPVFLHM